MSKETPPSQETQERPPYLTLDEVIQQAKETLLNYHWHKPTIILEGSLKTITGRFRELLPDFSVQIQQMYEAGLEMGKTEDVGSVEQAFLISELTLRTFEEHDCIEIKTKRKELFQVTHCEIKSKRVSTKSIEILYDAKNRVINFRDFEDEGNPMLEQDKALINTFLGAYLYGNLSNLRT